VNNEVVGKEPHDGQGGNGLKVSLSSGSTPHPISKATTEPRGHKQQQLNNQTKWKN